MKIFPTTSLYSISGHFLTDVFLVKENDTSTGKEGASSKMLSQLERKRIVNEEIIVTQVTPDLS